MNYAEETEDKEKNSFALKMLVDSRNAGAVLGTRFCYISFVPRFVRVFPLRASKRVKNISFFMINIAADGRLLLLLLLRLRLRYNFK